jgi:hypothetical protein
MRYLVEFDSGREHYLTCPGVKPGADMPTMPMGSKPSANAAPASIPSNGAEGDGETSGEGEEFDGEGEREAQAKADTGAQSSDSPESEGEREDESESEDGYSVVGPGVLDMGRYLMGHPEPYMVWTDADETQDINPDRVLRILCNGTANASAGSEVIWNRGAAAAVIADLAESQGVRVEIELVFANQSYSGSYSKFYIPLKRAQDHVPAELLAFALAHPSSLRRLMFGVWETLTAAERAIDVEDLAEHINLNHPGKEG